MNINEIPLSSPEYPSCGQPSAWTAGSVSTLVPVDPSADAWKKVIGKLYSMMSLSDDWDGLESPSPNPFIVAGAIELTRDLIAKDYPPPNRVVATPSGTVGFEWQISGSYMEAELVTPYRSEWMRIEESMAPQHWVLSTRPFIDSPREPVATTTSTVSISWRELYAAQEEAERISAFRTRARFRQNAQSAYWAVTAKAM
jgi:hypothetical protein